MEDVRIDYYHKKSVRFCESGRKINRTYGQSYIFCLIYKISSVKWFYSPDTKSFHFGSALNPDSSICINCSDSPWLFAICGLCFAEDTFVNY